MLLRARTIKAWGWVPLPVLGGCSRSPNASTPSITITKILAADGKDYDTVAAIEGASVGVRPDQQIVVYISGEEEVRFESMRRRRPDR
jgi:hypothetical protein